ncbi:MAG: PilZ domain-containing protein [Nitrospirota bacterium]
MEKRAFQRMPACIEFHCFETEYFGTVTDISEKGMFIRSQKICFPLDLKFKISISLEKDILYIPVKIKRITKSNGYYDGMGVVLLKRPHIYLKLINKLRIQLRRNNY